MNDEYRITLFKRNLREILGAPWIRFYRSKGRCHLCISRYDVGDDNIEIIPKILKFNRIEFVTTIDQFGLQRIFGGKKKRLKIDQISIPIDQEALPERKAKARKAGG